MLVSLAGVAVVMFRDQSHKVTILVRLVLLGKAVTVEVVHLAQPLLVVVVVSVATDR